MTIIDPHRHVASKFRSCSSPAATAFRHVLPAVAQTLTTQPSILPILQSVLFSANRLRFACTLTS